MISFDDFKKLDIRIGKILKAEPIEGSEKLVRLEVDIGDDPATDSASLPQAGSKQIRQIIAGIAKFYSPDQLVGREVPILTNLEPRILKGLESQGMLLAADADGPVLLVPEKEVPPGSVIR